MGKHKLIKGRLATPTSKLKKDPGVPRLSQLKKKQNLQQKYNKLNNLNDDSTPTSRQANFEGLVARASNDDIHDTDTESAVDVSGGTQNRRQYLKLLHQVVEQSDIIVLVLDARDPEGYRSKLVEEEVRRREIDSKKLIFVLNKIDLIPRSNAAAWLKYLRHIAPTIAFHASTQRQRSNITSKSPSALLSLLKSLKQPAASITVGIVGYPNVGKSSIINSLKRSKVCPVAPEPGCTKFVQTIQLEKGLKLLDSPGVIFDLNDSDKMSLLLRNVLKVEEISDPIAAAGIILNRVKFATISRVYSLSTAVNEQEFSIQEVLVQLALMSGRLKHAGIPDLDAVARSVIHDWHSHKIPFYSEPPTIHSSSLPGANSDEANVGEAKVIGSDFSPAFEIEYYTEAVEIEQMETS